MELIIAQTTLPELEANAPCGFMLNGVYEVEILQFPCDVSMQSFTVEVSSSQIIISGFVEHPNGYTKENITFNLNSPEDKKWTVQNNSFGFNVGEKVDLFVTQGSVNIKSETKQISIDGAILNFMYHEEEGRPGVEFYISGFKPFRNKLYKENTIHLI